MNLTGSPLEDDKSIKELLSSTIHEKIHLAKPWPEIEEDYAPVDTSLAREILMNVGNKNFPKETRGWIFILCAHEHSQSNFLIGTYVVPDQNVRSFARYLGIIKHEDKSMENLLKRHFSFIAPGTKTNTQMESTFEITPDVCLKFSNRTSALSPLINHINESSDVLLSQQVEIGKSHILCEDFWSQVQLLNHIKVDIINARNGSIDGTFSELAYNYGQNDMTFENMQEKVHKILSEIHVISEEGDALDTGLEAVIKRTRGRPLTEISDQLWDLLKFTSSYSDLKKTITFIFQIASRSNIVNFPTSSNRLSELIRELSQQRLAIPHLVGAEPLELLLEIGIEKLLKDYEFILSESRICQLSKMKFGGGQVQGKADSRLSVRKSLAAAGVDLNQSTRKTLLKTNNQGSTESNEDDDSSIRNSRFNEHDVEANISKLAQLHLVVEHLLLIQNNLAMDNDYAAISKKLFEKPLTMFDDLQYQKFDKFEISINDRKVIQLVDNLIPNSQKFVMHSGNKFKEITNVFYFNTEQIVPTLDQQKKEGDVVDNSGDSFHFISYTTINSKF